MKHHYVLAEVKAVKDAKGAATGEWEAVLSVPTLDRDGEVIAKGAFEPLPETIPIHAYHDFADPVGRGEPFYEGEELKARGGYASTSRAQEIRTLVEEGVIANMSVGFMAAEREEKDGIPTVTRAELLEASFVSVPSNREAAVLLAKSYEESKAGARNSGTDYERLQTIHDLSVANGAECKGIHPDTTKSFEELPDLAEGEGDESAEEAAGEAAAEESAAAEPAAESAEEAPNPEDEDTEQKEDLELQAQALALLAES